MDEKPLRRKKREPTYEDWDKLHRENYKRDLLNPHKWKEKGDVLLEVSIKMEPEVVDFWETWRKHLKDDTVRLKGEKYSGIYFMLVSYAIENYFKAIIVRISKKEFETFLNSADNPKFPSLLKTHKLVKLAQKAGFPIKDQLQEELLRRLSRSAVWYGRYPVSTDYKTSGKDIFRDGKEYDISLFREIDVNQVKVLIEEIKEFGNFK